MKIYNTTKENINLALQEVNKKFEDNIILNRFEERGIKKKSYIVTLKCKSSKKAGHRIGFYGRRFPSACWHVHGCFFEELFKLEENTEIVTAEKRITIMGGNWEDKNIGSVMQPLYYSEACDCGNLQG